MCLSNSTPFLFVTVNAIAKTIIAGKTNA
jgi:hypothetical protein